MSFLRTNYRITGGQPPAIGSFASVLLIRSLADIAGTFSMPGDGPLTLSTGGFGAPQWAVVVGQSTVTYCASLPVRMKISGDMSGSIFFLNADMSDSLFSHTVNAQVLILVGSR